MESAEISVSIDDDFPPVVDLDENGFPLSAPPSSEDDDDDEADTKTKSKLIDPCSSVGARSFASDFYRSGTDWSTLAKEKKEERSLVQRDLFQVWRIKKPEAEPKPRAPQRDLFEMWGIKKPKEEEPKPRVLSPPRKRHRAAAVGGASVDNDASRSGSHRPRACPFYKKIPGTPFTVDAFRYGSVDGCTSYFLSHFHYDHYGGLSKRWSHGPIYCTPITARLVKMCLGVNSLYICPLELGEENVIEGVKVTLLEANHCPGAALIHFRLKDGRCYLHTGDFRASKPMQSYPLLNQHINMLYLDTTYCNPKYRFPPKEDVVSFVVRITRNYLAKHPKTLIVVGAYSIGKEQVYLAISHALGLPNIQMLQGGGSCSLFVGLTCLENFVPAEKALLCMFCLFLSCDLRI
ncbi:DNA cross-link repair protein SNM1 [Iris pallida]|uniref:DNA cross-link repair protein SNM1 n=1 Tax=Iris pallida TaxID=29817 RepID=A0AAX6H9U8_IRIPA|nr:DNA cross-link repair protein SNM1 [Iris pallida]